MPRHLAFGLLFALSFALAACASLESPTSTPPVPTLAPTALPLTTSLPEDAFSDLPDEVRAATHRGEPRTAGYWLLWNACTEGNKAEVARANGGRAAGWILVDDLLEDPGIQLGDHRVTTCEEAVSLLQGRSSAGEETDDPIYGLAAALLAAELNLNVGAETCPIAEEAVLGGHLVLASTGFDGTGDYPSATSGEIANAIPKLVDLLAVYNNGELCR